MLTFIHWLIVGIAIGTGLVFTRPILIMLTYAVITMLAFAIAGAVIAFPAFIIGFIKGFFFP